MNTNILVAVFLLLTACPESSLPSAETNQSSASPAQVVEYGAALPASAQGTWSVFYLPTKWISEHGLPEAYERVYVALAGPHVTDLEGDYAPCDPPHRIILGVVDKDSSIRERLAFCLEYCSEEDTPTNTYKGLWGSLTHLEGVHLNLLENGSVNVIQHYRKKEFTMPEEYTDPKEIDRLPLGDEVRIRADIIRPSDFRFKDAKAGSCLGLRETEGE